MGNFKSQKIPKSRTFIFHEEWVDTLCSTDATPEERLEMFDALINFAFRGNQRPTDKYVKAATSLMLDCIKKDMDAYVQTCERNAAIAREREVRKKRQSENAHQEQPSTTVHDRARASTSVHDRSPESTSVHLL